MIPFNKPTFLGTEPQFMLDAIHRGQLSGNGYYTKLCQEFFEKRNGFLKTLLTTSCTAALEMCAMLCDIHAGDEVIMPSYTFPSMANAFALRGAKIIFNSLQCVLRLHVSDNYCNHILSLNTMKKY